MEGLIFRILRYLVVVIKTRCLIGRCTATDAGPFKNPWTPASFWKPLTNMSLSQLLYKVQKGSSDRKSRFCLCRIKEKDHDVKNGNRHGYCLKITGLWKGVD